MVWIYDKEDSHSHQEYHKFHFPSGAWWNRKDTNIDCEIQLNAETIQKLKRTFDLAYNAQKPLTFMIRKCLTVKLGRIENNAKPNQLLIDCFGFDLYTEYDPEKINNLTSNSIKLYQNWEDIPQRLQRFIMDINYDSNGNLRNYP